MDWACGGCLAGKGNHSQGLYPHPTLPHDSPAAMGAEALPCGSSTDHPPPPLWSVATAVSSFENASSAERLPLLSVMSFSLSGTPAGMEEEARPRQRVLVLGRAGPAKPALTQDSLSHCWLPGKGFCELERGAMPQHTCRHAYAHAHRHTNTQRHTCAHTDTHEHTCMHTHT